MVLIPDSRVTHESSESAHVLLCHEQCRHELQMNSADGACMCMHTHECTIYMFPDPVEFQAITNDSSTGAKRA